MREARTRYFAAKRRLRFARRLAALFDSPAAWRRWAKAMHAVRRARRGYIAAANEAARRAAQAAR